MTAKTFADFGIVVRHDRGEEDTTARARGSSGRFEAEARAAARAAGMKRYVSGRACPKWHIGDRFVSNCGCVACLLQQNRESYVKCREERCARSRNYAKERPAENRERSNAARYMSTRVPAWADRKAIQEFYRNCPPGMVVDHVLPMKGKHVCGLHVLENLQYLTPLENSVKGMK